MITAAEVRVVHRWIDGTRRRQPCALRRRHRNSDIAGDGRYRLSLKPNDVAGGPFVGLPPPVSVSANVDEFHGQANSILGKQHRALDDSIDLQFTSNLPDGLGRASIVLGRLSRDDAECVNRCKLRRQRFGDPIDQVTLTVVGREILERNDRQGLNRILGAGSAGGLFRPKPRGSHAH